MSKSCFDRPFSIKTPESRKCPTCGSQNLKYAYQLHTTETTPAGRLNWTTRKYREQNGIEPASGQKLIVPPQDNTWFGCAMCNTEFDDEGVIYSELKMPPFVHRGFTDFDQEPGKMAATIVMKGSIEGTFLLSGPKRYNAHLLDQKWDGKTLRIASGQYGKIGQFNGKTVRVHNSKVNEHDFCICASIKED